MPYKILKIIELCEVLDEKTTEETTGLRTIAYEISKSKSLVDAIIDYEDNFDSDRVIESFDDFEGECLDSTIVSASFQDC